jgi:hypothetical protein
LAILSKYLCPFFNSTSYINDFSIRLKEIIYLFLSSVLSLLFLYLNTFLYRNLLFDVFISFMRIVSGGISQSSENIKSLGVSFSFHG